MKQNFKPAKAIFQLSALCNVLPCGAWFCLVPIRLLLEVLDVLERLLLPPNSLWMSPKHHEPKVAKYCIIATPAVCPNAFCKRRQHHLVCFNAMFLQNMQPITVKPTHVYAPALGGFSCDTIKPRRFLFWIFAFPPIYSKCKNKRIKKHSGHLLRTFSLQDKIPKSKAQ